MRILFCCMGNICRSPTAEGVFRRALLERAPQLEVHIDSAGTHDYHIGEAPDARARAAAIRRGIDISRLRARQIAPQDFERFDLILAMDEDNVRELTARAPRQYRDRIRLFMEFAPNSPRRAVPDPYYGGEQGFEDVLDMLEEAANGLIDELLARMSASARH
jgi:protein-tyrosine phosphatase